MDTGVLRGFAVWARGALIRDVSARLVAVLAPGSVERVEQAGVVAGLEKEVAAAGGGQAGQAAVAERAAYVWFNRLVALRFMDANGYTGVGVVSPPAGVVVGQPEVLADAKRGVIDAEVVGEATRALVLGLLDGTRPSSDGQGEAYGLLLAAHCRYWHQAMPFMFEREGDFTELLIPADLLADDSVLNRAVGVLTEQVCADVEVIGWLYQFYIADRKDEVFAGFKKNKKAGAAEIPAATQLFTPHWIVRYLVENSVGRLWMLNNPQSRLVEQMDYYIAPVEDETDFSKISTPQEITVIDPACGSGHMLTYAFDVLYAIYEEQGYSPSEIPGLILTHNLFGAEIDPRAGALAAFALTMKARAKQRTFFNKRVEPNICVLQPVVFTDDELDILYTPGGDKQAEAEFWNQFEHADLFGSLIQPDPELTTRLGAHLDTLDAHSDLLTANTIDRAQQVLTQARYLTPGYTTVIANPPYMGAKNMDVVLSRFATAKFPEAKPDLMTMFVERATHLLISGGIGAVVTRDAWMFLSRFADFRRRLVRRVAICSLAHFGQGVFDGMSGAVVQVVGVCFTLSRRVPLNLPGTYVRLTDLRSNSEKDLALRAAAVDGQHPLRFNPQQSQFEEMPGAPIAYWASSALRRTFASGRRVEDLAPVRQGFQTGDNDGFVRFWFEVSVSRVCFGAKSTEEFHESEARFAPYLKGGGFRKWYGNDDYVVAFAKSDYATLAKMGNHLPSRDRYFEESITWSALSSGAFGARYAGAGSTFSAKGACAFPRDEASRDLVLAVFNSSVTRDLLAFMGATLDFNVGSLREIPLPNQLDEADVTKLQSLVGALVAIHRTDWNTNETAPGFLSLQTLMHGAVGDPISIKSITTRLASFWETETSKVLELQSRLDTLVAASYGLSEVERLPITLRSAVTDETTRDQHIREQVVDLVSYSVGCMFGRYSLDVPGLILADQGASLEDYLARVPSPSFAPDADNVIPIVDGDWFEDDIVERFRRFLRVAFGEEHFEENLRFVTESLGVKNLRDYFVKSFYKDHVQRYKKRPIYWLFSSPKGSFNALIYMHRYTPSTVSTVLNEYLREFQAKLKASLEHAERNNNAKEADRLRKILLELDAYEHDVLYPLASQNFSIDLDDGVKANYPKFGAALKKIPGLETKE